MATYISNCFGLSYFRKETELSALEAFFTGDNITIRMPRRRLDGTLLDMTL
jgi:hypothetical protein